MRIRRVEKGFTKMKKIAAAISTIATAGIIITAVVRKLRK